MTAFVALIRAVNVAGTGKLPKDELKAMGEACGFENVRTFINSGNLLFTSDLMEATAKKRVEERLAEHFGRTVPAFVPFDFHSSEPCAPSVAEKYTFPRTAVRFAG